MQPLCDLAASGDDPDRALFLTVSARRARNRMLHALRRANAALAEALVDYPTASTSRRACSIADNEPVLPSHQLDLRAIPAMQVGAQGSSAATARVGSGGTV